MDVQPVVMERDVADKAFREYRAAWVAEHNRIDGELMRGYRALAQGKSLISLTETITKGGLDSIGRPALAIARADEAAISMRFWADGSVNYEPAIHARAQDRVFRFGPDTLTPLPPSKTNSWFEPWGGNWQARLPFIPPLYRPPYALENYHLLWEAEWKRDPKSQRLDPMLLRRIGGDVFAVVAAWDLSPLEKLVLAR